MDAISNAISNIGVIVFALVAVFILIKIVQFGFSALKLVAMGLVLAGLTYFIATNI